MTTTGLRPAVGRDVLAYRDARHPDSPPVVHSCRPAARGPDDPAVLVQLGIKRDGVEYRDFGIEAAERHRLLIAATTFGSETFPKPEDCDNGGDVAPDATIRTREDWLYAILPLLVTIRGVGHDGCAMGKAAAAVWFEGRVPAAGELATGSVPVA